jgi:SAM-dependent methyltransferase
MSMLSSGDSWNEGTPYDRYVGRWSGPVARDFLGWLDLPPALRWLDVGCGTGALTAAIAATCRPAALFGVDPSAGFLATARERLRDVATFQVGSATSLPLPEASVDVVVSGLVLNFVPDPQAGIAEMKRAARPGGTLAAYVWDYGGRMQMMRYFWDAATGLDPDAHGLDEARRFPICEPAALEKAFRDAGLTAVDGASIEVATRFSDFDDYWKPVLGGQGPAPTYVAALTEAARTRLRDRLRERLPVQADGSIALVARAWGVRGRVPDAPAATQ